MKKLLPIVLIGSLWATSALAADNGLQVTNGSGPTLRSIDVGAGVQAVGHAIIDATGGQLGTSTSPLFIRAASGFFASGAFASGSVASGAFASGSLASGSMAAGAMVDLLTMRGTVGAGTAAANSLLTGCIYNSTPITLTNGQGAAQQCSVNGYQTVVVSNTLTALTPGDGITTGTYASGSPVLGASLLWNGTTYDRWKSGGVTGVAAVATQASVSGGSTPYTPFVPAASDNHQTVKNGAGTAYSVITSNNSATKNYLRLYDAGTGFNGCNSATGVIFAMEIPPTDSGFAVSVGGVNGLAFTTGLSLCVTSGFGLTDTTSATATAMYVNIAYK